MTNQSHREADLRGETDGSNGGQLWKKIGPVLQRGGKPPREKSSFKKDRVFLLKGITQIF